jgi:hypothetical protein
LEAIPLSQSNAAAIAKDKAAFLLLKDEPGSELWFQLQLRLGEMLQELAKATIFQADASTLLYRI